VVLTVAWVVSACGGTSARPTDTSGGAATATSGAASSGDVTRLFDYDRRQPLATTTQQTREEADGITVASITYASPKGGEVPALVVLPSARGPFPGVIVQHGMPDTKEGMLSAGIDLARTGAVVLLIDAPFNRPQQGRVRSEPLTFTPKDRDEQIQLIVDLRRAVDLLVARRDVDTARLAYYGVSYGAAMGGLLAGVEHRLKAYVLAVGDGGLVSHFTAGHFLNCAARKDMMAWLARHIRIDPRRYTCTP
jgi:cephalosporin-C deacetylase-like acetyl esterase